MKDTGEISLSVEAPSLISLDLDKQQKLFERRVKDRARRLKLKHAKDLVLTRSSLQRHADDSAFAFKSVTTAGQPVKVQIGLSVDLSSITEPSDEDPVGSEEYVALLKALRDFLSKRSLREASFFLLFASFLFILLTESYG